MENYNNIIDLGINCCIETILTKFLLSDSAIEKASCMPRGMLSGGVLLAEDKQQIYHQVTLS